MGEQLVENSLVSCNNNLFDNSVPSISFKENEIVSHSISSELFPASGEGSLLHVDPISVNSSTSNIKEGSISKNDSSIPIMYSIQGTISEECKLCDNKSTLENSDAPCFTPSDKLSSNLSSNQCCFESETAMTPSKFLKVDQLQLLMQDWMEIMICKVSIFLRSIYGCFLKLNYLPTPNSSESALDVGII